MRKILTLLFSVLICSVWAFSQGYEYEMINYPYRQAIVNNDAVWIASVDGLVKYDKLSGFYHTYVPENSASVHTLAEMPDGDIVVGNYNGKGAAVFDGERFESLLRDNKEFKNVSVLLYADGLWLSSFVDIYRLEDNEWTFYDVNLAGYSSNFVIRALAYDDTNDCIWFGSRGSLNESTGYFTNTGARVILSDLLEATVNDIYINQVGRVYIATSNGLVTYTYGDTAVRSLMTDIVTSSSNCQCVAGAGNQFWYSAKNQLVHFNGEQYRLYTCELSEHENDFIVNLIPDGEKLWVLMAYAGLLEFKNGEFSEPTPGLSGVENIISDPGKEEFMYDLNGQIISAPTKGQIYIQGGKKFVGR